MQRLNESISHNAAKGSVSETMKTDLLETQLTIRYQPAKSLDNMIELVKFFVLKAGVC